MSWFSFSSKILNIVLILPLILNILNENELNVYFLFITIIATSNVIDFGFKSTFVRLFSYASTGLKSIDRIKYKKNNSKAGVNWDLTERIFSASKKIYLIISIFLSVILITVGSFLVMDSISLNAETIDLWISWIYIIITASISFYGRIYVCYLEGFNKVALIRRVEGYFALITVISKLLVLYFWPSILGLIFVEKTWLIINVFRNYYLSKKINQNKISKFKSIENDYPFLKKIFNLAWKNGVSGILSIGITNFTGIIYAQIGSISNVNSYLISLRVLTLLRDFSKAPFYSKIPLLSKLRAENNLSLLIKTSQRNMTFSNLIFILGAAFIGLFAEDLLNFIKSNANLVETNLWILMSVAFFIHRYGSMHLQLYLTTNHIISHIIDSVSAIIFIILTLFLFEDYELYSFPISMIISYLCCHTWVSVSYSIKSLNTNFIFFEKYNIIIIIFLIIIFYLINA